MPIEVESLDFEKTEKDLLILEAKLRKKGIDGIKELEMYCGAREAFIFYWDNCQGETGWTKESLEFIRKIKDRRRKIKQGAAIHNISLKEMLERLQKATPEEAREMGKKTVACLSLLNQPSKK
jgi:hypothetical protein